MSEENRIKYSMHELTEILVKDQGLTEGMWMLSVEFRIGAVNSGIDDQNLAPTAMVPLVSVGLIPADKGSNLTIDASKLK